MHSFVFKLAMIKLLLLKLISPVHQRGTVLGGNKLFDNHKVLQDHKISTVFDGDAVYDVTPGNNQFESLDKRCKLCSNIQIQTPHH